MVDVGISAVDEAVVEKEDEVIGLGKGSKVS